MGKNITIHITTKNKNSPRTHKNFYKSTKGQNTKENRQKT